MRSTSRQAILAAVAILCWAAPVAARPSEDALVVHVLNRAGYGPRPGDVERVRAMGVRAWIALQLHPERIPDDGVARRLASLRSLGMTPLQLAGTYPLPNVAKRIEKLKQEGKMEQAERLQAMLAPEAQRGRPRDILEELISARLIRAAHSERQLQEVMVDFWMNHFNVYWNKGADRYLLTAYERDVIRPRAFGKFRDLLLATAQSPAMLFYLDNWLSSGADAPTRGQRKAGLNENYARELMELHTLGVDGGYTQADVVEVARCLTGWSVQDPRRGGGFLFRRQRHDDGRKTVLGQVIPAGGGEQDGLTVIDLLARHPRTAQFIARKLCRRFVADDPPPALVERVAAAFRQSDGDIRATLQALLTSPEFLSLQYARAKIKTPLELVVSSIRAVGAETRGGLTLAAALNRMGMLPYACQPPTGYADRADAWVSSGALLERLSFAVALMQGRMVGTEVDVRSLLAGVPPERLDAAADRLIQTLLGGECSAQTRATILQAAEDPHIKRARLDDAVAAPDYAKLIGLVLGSPEFQRR